MRIVDGMGDGLDWIGRELEVGREEGRKGAEAVMARCTS